MSAVIPRSTITEIVGYRDAALKAYEEAFDAIEAAHEKVEAAKKLVQQAAPLNHAYTHAHAPEITAFESAVQMPDRQSYIMTARRLTDIRVWGHLIQHTELEQLMDKEAKDQLRDQMAFVAEKIDPQTGQVLNQEEIDKGLPPVDVDTIEATLRGFAESSGDIFRRGLANVFTKLDRKFRSHDGFKVGSRMILSRAFDDWGSWNYHTHHRDSLIDIERVFMVLDGKDPKAIYGGLVPIVDAERKEISRTSHTGLNGYQSEHEGDYFKIRVFKNGNAHLWFTRKDLVEKVNKELAAYYGEVIADGKDNPENQEEDYTEQMAVGHAKHFGFFPTPKPVVERIVEAARMWRADGEKPFRVLEPSAGTGRIAQALADTGAAVFCVEIQGDLAEKLVEADRYRNVLFTDFLKIPAPEKPVYDRVVMNPPFDGQRDIDHVRHAWEFLKPGGRLVAVMSAGVEFRENKKAITFRKWVGTHKGKFHDLPAGSFIESGTNVNTVYLVIDKPKEA